MKTTVTKFLSRIKKGFAHWSVAISFTVNLYFIKLTAKFERKAKTKPS